MQLTSRRAPRGFTLIELLVVIAIIALLAAILFPVFARARENARRSTCQNNMKQVGVGIAQYTQDYDEMMPYDYFGNNTGISTASLAGSPNSAGARALGVWDQYRWPYRIYSYVKNRQIFICPSGRRWSSVVSGTPNDDLMSYWCAGAMFAKPTDQPVSLSEFTRPAQAVTLYDDLDGNRRDQIVFRPFYDNGNSYRYNGGAVAGSTFSTPRTPVHLDAVNVLYGDGHVKSQRLEILYQQACPGYTGTGLATTVSCGLP